MYTKENLLGLSTDEILELLNSQENENKELKVYYEEKTFTQVATNWLKDKNKAESKLNAIREVVEDIKTYNIYPHKHLTSDIIENYMKQILSILEEE